MSDTRSLDPRSSAEVKLSGSSGEVNVGGGVYIGGDVSVTATRRSPTGSVFRTGHALIVGVGADLPNTMLDALGLAGILRDTERCAYPSDHVHVLTGEEATRERILEGLDRLAGAAGPRSSVLVYFSGHGYRVTTTIGPAYYLMPYGYDVNQLYKTAISGAEFTAKLRAIPAQKLLVLLDCCHAGGVGEAKAAGLEMVKAPLPPEALELLAEGSGRVLIASSTEKELSYAGKPYSAFTLALIEALCGAGVAKQDGYVRVADLALHTREMVPGRTGNKQHPVLHFEQADNFVVAFYAGGDTKPKGLPFQEEPQIEPEPGAWRTMFDQRGQTVHGSQTNIVGDVYGPVLSGQFGDRITITGDGNVVGQGSSSRVIKHTGSGDQVLGDKVGGDKITVGNIQGTGIAIGRGAQAHVQQGISAAELDKLFAPLVDLARDLPPDQREPAEQKILELKREAARGKNADDSRLAHLIDRLVDLVPAAVSTVASMFATPILGGLVGPVTKFVLDKLRGDQS